MALSLNFINSILCEYVGRGENGKPLLINVIAGDLLVGTLPGDLIFGLYLECATHPKDISTISIDILLGGRRIVGFDAHIGGPLSPGPTVIAIQHFQLHVDNETNLEIVAHGGGYRRNVMISKKINVDARLNVTNPIASSPPSAQSQNDALPTASRLSTRRLSSRPPGGEI